MKLLPTLLRFVQMTSMKHRIDESHSLGHSMEVLHYANHIYKDSVIKYPELYTQEAVIYTAAIVHDMCDKKYLNQTDGICQINNLLKHKMNYHDIDKVEKIISTMSYSTVKKNSYPNLGNFQMAYHIVREADLLAAYDFDRAIIYNMHKSDGDFSKSYENSIELFSNRVLKHHTDELFITDYSKKKGLELHEKALSQIQSWEKIVNTYDCTYIL